MHIGEKNFGISAGSGEICLTIRARENNDLKLLQKRIEDSASALAQADGVQVHFAEQDAFPATVNAPDAAARLEPYLRRQGFAVRTLAEPMWLLWHLGAADRRVHLKQGRDYLRYILLSALAAAGCGLLGLAVPSAGTFAELSASVFALNLMVGIPVIILLTSTVCTLPVLPFWSRQEPDIAGRIEPDPESLEVFNEQLEDYSQAHGLLRLFHRLLQPENSCLQNRDRMSKNRINKPFSAILLSHIRCDSISSRFSSESGKRTV